MLNFLILFLGILAEAYLINYFLVRSFVGTKWRIFVAPGVIIHELTHALACFITGAKIVKISFFDKDGGSVTHQKPFIPIFGPILISLAPLVVGILIFYYLARLIRLESSSDFQTIYFNFKTIFQTINFASWRNVIVIYLLLAVAVTMTPSKQDLLNILWPILFVAAVFYLIVRFSSAGAGYFNLIIVKFLPIFNLVVFILFGFLVISLVFFSLTKLIFKR